MPTSRRVLNLQERVMEIRPIDFPRDAPALHELEIGFVTDCVYALRREPWSFALEEVRLPTPLTKQFVVKLDAGEVESALVALAAWETSTLLGYAIVEREAWNRRAALRHFYVGAGGRRRGVGRALMQRTLAGLDPASVRLLWAETQNTNHPAIQFYRRMGFHLCGLDESLYDHPAPPETALYFCREIDRTA
ncbi:MAG: GNAT family N-acetyltransferase [Opitutales bacterium]